MNFHDTYIGSHRPVESHRRAPMAAFLTAPTAAVVGSCWRRASCSFADRVASCTKEEYLLAPVISASANSAWEFSWDFPGDFYEASEL